MTVVASGDASGAEPTAAIVRVGAITLHRRDYFDAAGEYVIRGGTFELEEELTASGCRWNPALQAWTADSEAAGRVVSRLRERSWADLPTPDRRDPGSIPGLAEEPCVSGWTVVGLSADPRQRRLNRLARLPPEFWADEGVLEILLGKAFPDLGAELGAWLLERFGGFGGMLAAEAPRYAEHPTLAPSGVVGTTDAAERHVRLTLLLKAVAQILQRSLREQIQDRPVIGSWTALLDYLQAAMQHEAAEHFRLLFLDRKNILIRDEVQSRGTVDHTPLYPREVLKRALELSASALIMVHNHPSGDPTPSQADIDMTKQVVAALAQVNITVHDHIIVGKNRHTSFKTQKLI